MIDQRPVESLVVFGDSTHPENNVDVAAVLAGIWPVGTVERLMVVLGIKQKQQMLELLDIPRYTFSRRRHQGVLKAAESDRVRRYTRLAEQIRGAFSFQSLIGGSQAPPWFSTYSLITDNGAPPQVTMQ